MRTRFARWSVVFLTTLMISLPSMGTSKTKSALEWYRQAQKELSKKKWSMAQSSLEKVIQLKSPIELAAQVYLVRALLQQSQTDEAIKILNQINRLPQGKPEKIWAIKKINSFIRERHFQYLHSALKAYEVKNNPDAEKALNEALKFSETDQAYLLLSLLFLRQENLAQAKASLAITIALSQTPGVEAAARRLLTEIQRRERDFEPPWSAMLEMAAGFRSNVFVTPSTIPPRSVPYYQFNGAIAYRIPGINWGDLQFEYDPYIEETSTLPEYRLISHSLQASFQKNFGNYRLGLNTSFDNQSLGSRPYLVSARASANISQLSVGHEMGLLLSSTKVSSTNWDYAYLDGFNFKGGPFYQLMGNQLISRLGIYYQKEQSSDLTLYNGLLVIPLANQSLGADLTFVLFPEEDWTLRSVFSYQRLWYQTKVMPEKTNRQDGGFTWSTQIRKRLFDSFELFGSLITRSNTSTMGPQNLVNRNFKQSTFLVGFTWGGIQ